MPIGMYRPKMSKEEAEKFFNKKATPESNMPPKEFMKKEIIQPVKNTVRRFGRIIKSGAKSLIQPSIDYNKAQKAKDDAYREEGEDLMMGREKYKGSMK
jgi:hypothetical protein